jgi:hypothetical protein
MDEWMDGAISWDQRNECDEDTKRTKPLFGIFFLAILLPYGSLACARTHWEMLHRISGLPQSLEVLATTPLVKCVVARR